MPSGFHLTPTASPIQSPTISPIQSPIVSSNNTISSFYKQIPSMIQDDNIHQPIPQKQTTISTIEPSKSPSHIDTQHHKDSFSQQQQHNDMNRVLITPSPCTSEIMTSTSISMLSDMLLSEMSSLKKQYQYEINQLRNEIQQQQTTYQNEIINLKKIITKQTYEYNEFITRYEKSEVWRVEKDIEYMNKYKQHDLLITELSSELSHTRAKLPRVAATADAAAVSAAQAVASAKALVVSRTQQPNTNNNNNKKNGKKPRKQSTPLLPTPPRHMWNTMPTPGVVASTTTPPTIATSITSPTSSTTPTTPTSIPIQSPTQQQQQHIQSHSQPTSTNNTPRGMSMSTIPSSPRSRVARFASVPAPHTTHQQQQQHIQQQQQHKPIHTKHTHNDSLSDVIGMQYIDEDGDHIEDELTLYMKNRGRAATTPLTNTNGQMLPITTPGVTFSF